MTEPSTEFYTVTIQKPDGDGWATVHTKTNATGRSAADAARDVLRYHWPVSIYDKDPNQYVRRRAVLTGTAGWRAVVTPATHNRRGDSGTFTFAELATADLRRLATARKTARETVAAARRALRDAQTAERLAGYDLETARHHAANLGVPAADITKAARTPRRPSQT